MGSSFPGRLGLFLAIVSIMGALLFLQPVLCHLLRNKERCLVLIPQHRLGVVRVCRVDGFLVLR